MPVYEEKLICPFAIRFSQDHIRTTFQDRRKVEDTVAEIESKAGDEKHDYDVILEAPFPHIEIARWRPKGFERDDKHWFTLDNRRLYCLQKAAAAHWPKTVAVVVQTLYDHGGSMWKKYDSSTFGRSVRIADHLKSTEIKRWDWYQECVARGIGISMARAATVVLRDDDKKVIDDLANATEESGLMALARTVGAGQCEQDTSRPGSKSIVSVDEPELMLELARRCGEGSDASALCPTPSTSTEDTDGENATTEDSSSDNGASAIADANSFGNNFNDPSAYANYCSYGGYSGHGGFGGYGGFNGFGGGYPYSLNPSMALLNLQAQQAAVNAHMAAAQYLRFQAMSLGPAQNPFQRQSVPARGRAARSKASAQK